MKPRLKSVSLLVGMETVKAAYNFLKSQPPAGDEWAKRIGELLCWPYTRVQEALANLRSAKEIDLEGIGKNKDVIHVPSGVFKTLPTQAHATVFRQAVESTEASPNVQREVAKELAKGSADKD